MRLAGLLVAGLVCVGMTAGCAASRLVAPDHLADGNLAGPVSLPSIGQPTPVTLGSLKLPSHQAVEKALTHKSDISGYRLLTESQCQCLAAAESTLGKLLASERQSVLTGVVGRRDREAQGRTVLANALGLRSVDERNRSAAAAMELYYRLAGSYFARDRLDRSLDEARRSIDDFRKAKQTGLSVPGDEAKLLAQEIELKDRKSQLDAAIGQIDEQLCQLLGLERDPSDPLWPGAEMTVSVSPIDIEAAVAEGARLRPDLALLCVLRENVNEQTLGPIRSALAKVDPMMGRPAPKKHMVSTAVHRARICLETQVRQEQLEQLLESQRRSAEDEIRRAASDAEKRLRQIGLAKDMLDQSQGLLRRLRERREAKGAPQASEIRAAQLDVLRDEADAFQAVVEWKIALVKLKQSQGLLAAECGYTLPASCCEGCLDATKDEDGGRSVQGAVKPSTKADLRF
jgi:hypothetical protein